MRHAYAGTVWSGFERLWKRISLRICYNGRSGIMRLVSSKLWDVTWLAHLVSRSVRAYDLSQLILHIPGSKILITGQAKLFCTEHAACVHELHVVGAVRLIYASPRRLTTGCEDAAFQHCTNRWILAPTMTR